MTDLSKTTRENVEELVSKYIPLFKYLDQNNIDYCCCGGLAVLLHALKRKELTVFRNTEDLDLFLPLEFEEDDIKNIYLAVYAKDNDTAKFIHDEVFGEGSYEGLLDEQFDDYVKDRGNISFDGQLRTPNIDALKWLNGKTIDTIKREIVDFKGIKIKVASLEDLLYMKESVINLYKGNFDSRPQDYIDANLLRKMIGDQNG